MVEGIRHTSVMELLRSVSCMSLSTQLLALVLLLSRCYTPPANTECRRQNTTSTSYNRWPCSSCHSWVSFITLVFKLTLACCHSIKLYENRTYTPHATRSSRVKSQRQEYTEQCTTENNNIYIYNYVKNCNRTH